MHRSERAAKLMPQARTGGPGALKSKESKASKGLCERCRVARLLGWKGEAAQSSKSFQVVGFYIGLIGLFGHSSARLADSCRAQERPATGGLVPPDCRPKTCNLVLNYLFLSVDGSMTKTAPALSSEGSLQPGQCTIDARISTGDAIRVSCPCHPFRATRTGHTQRSDGHLVNICTVGKVGTRAPEGFFGWFGVVCPGSGFSAAGIGVDVGAAVAAVVRAPGVCWSAPAVAPHGDQQTPFAPLVTLRAAAVLSAGLAEADDRTAFAPLVRAALDDALGQAAAVPPAVDSRKGLKPSIPPLLALR